MYLKKQAVVAEPGAAEGRSWSEQGTRDRKRDGWGREGGGCTWEAS